MFQGKYRSTWLGLNLIATLLTLIGFLFLLHLNNATTGYRFIDFGLATFALLQVLFNRWISVDPAKSPEARFFAMVRSNVSILLFVIVVILGIVYPTAYNGFPCYVVAVLIFWIGLRTIREFRRWWQ